MSTKQSTGINTNKAFKLLWRYIVSQKGKISLGILATFAIGLMELLTGSFLKFLTNTVTKIQGLAEGGKALKIPVKLNIDFKLLDEKINIFNSTLSGSEDIMKGIIYISLVFFILYLFQGLFQYMREIFMNLAIERVLQKFKSDIFRAVVKAPLRLYEKNKAGEVISRVNYDVAVLTETINILIEISRFAIYMIMFIPAMFMINSRFALFTILFFPVSFIIIRFVASVIKKSSKDVSDNVGDYTSFLDERINRLRFIKGNRTEELEQKKFDDLVETNYQFRKRLIFQRFFLKPSNEVLGMLVLSVLFIFFGKNLLAGNGNVGDIAFFLYLVKTSFKPVKKVARAVGDLNMALISTGKIERVFEMEQEREVYSNRIADSGIETIKISDLHFSYGKTDILVGSSLDLKKGEKILLNGETGAGKTTLCSLLSLFNEVPDKSMFINGLDINSLSLYDVRSRIIYVSGETPLIPGTVEENLLYGTSASSDELERFRGFLPEWIYKSPDLRISGDENSITSGEARKISLVRALLSKGDVLILDEAFTYMDNVDIELYMTYLSDLDTALIVSRNTIVSNYVDKEFTLKDGVII